MDEISQKAPLGGLARQLVQLGLLQENRAYTASEQAIKEKKPFTTYLVEKGLINSTLLATTCSQEFVLPIYDLATFDLEVIPKNDLHRDLILKHHALPME